MRWATRLFRFPHHRGVSVITISAVWCNESLVTISSNIFVVSVKEKYFLVNSGYANRRGFLTPYRSTNYHLRDRRRLGGDRKNELFNYRHASLCNTVERTFRIWKSKFRILIGVPHYPFQTQMDIIIACAVIHNFLMMSFDVDVSLTAE